MGRNLVPTAETKLGGIRVSLRVFQHSQSLAGNDQTQARSAVGVGRGLHSLGGASRPVFLRTGRDPASVF